MSNTVSLVDVSPSTVILLNDLSTAFFKADCNVFLSTAASVTINASIVAIFGHIIPAPLAMPKAVISLPPILHFSNAIFGNASVVIIALTASFQPFDERDETSFGMPFFSLSIGSLCPITPVDETIAKHFFIPRASSTAAAMLFASSMPFLPVQALALPLFIIIA